MNKMINKVRGASLVEYALLLVLIMIAAAATFKTLGSKVGSSADTAGGKL